MKALSLNGRLDGVVGSNRDVLRLCGRRIAPKEGMSVGGGGIEEVVAVANGGGDCV